MRPKCKINYTWSIGLPLFIFLEMVNLKLFLKLVRHCPGQKLLSLNFRTFIFLGRYSNCSAEQRRSERTSTAENTHLLLKGKYHCTADQLGFGQRSKSVFLRFGHPDPEGSGPVSRQDCIQMPSYHLKPNSALIQIN